LADGIANQFLVVVRRKIHRVVGRFAAALKTARVKRFALAMKKVRTMLTRPAEKQKAGGNSVVCQVDRGGQWLSPTAYSVMAL